MNNLVKFNGNVNALDTSAKNGIETTGNITLDGVTKSIFSAINTSANCQFEIAVMLENVKSNEKTMFKGTDFKNIEDYGNRMFGFKRAYIYKLINITRFLDVNEIVMNGSGSKYLEIKPLCDSDGYSFGLSQLVELTRLSDKEVNDNIALLDAGDSCKTIREKVDKILGKETKSENENEKEKADGEKEKGKETTFEIKNDMDRLIAITEITKGFEDEKAKNALQTTLNKILAEMKNNG